MKMLDYESGRNLRDIDIELTRSEAEELATRLSRLLQRKDLKKVFLTDFSEGMLERGLTVSIETQADQGVSFTTG